MAYLDTDDGGRVYYEHHRGDKLPVVLIHGWGMSGDYWASAVEALLAEGHGAITIDHRGCGRSDRDFADLSIEAIARDVAAIVERSGAPRIALNGWSLGAAVAVAAADLLGQRVAGLILTCGATPRYTQAEGFPHGGTAEDVLGIGAAITADRPGFFRALAEGASGEGASEAMIGWVERGFIATGRAPARRSPASPRSTSANCSPPSPSPSCRSAARKIRSPIPRSPVSPRTAQSTAPCSPWTPAIRPSSRTPPPIMRRCSTS